MFPSHDRLARIKVCYGVFPQISFQASNPQASSNSEKFNQEVLARLVPAPVFKTVEPHGNHVVGGFDSHAFPPLMMKRHRPIPSTSITPTLEDGSELPRCLGCFRPAAYCYCDLIPEIENQTELLIIQHARERDHPFNTARMVRMAFNKSRLLCGTNQSLSKIEFGLRPGAGLLYPSPSAPTLSELPPHSRPQQLVIVDGTWAQAKTMIRDLPQLQELACYKIAPTQPGQYRIRLEPTDTSLSTVEAAVAAIGEVEPNINGLKELIGAFDQMVQRQLDHPKVGREHYSGGPKSGTTINIPQRLLGDENNIVVAYGEAAYRDVDRLAQTQVNDPRPPLVWVAVRLGTGELFSRTLKPDVPMTDSFLEHLELSGSHFDDAVTVGEFRNDWQRFLRANDTLAVYNHGTEKLLANVEADFAKCVALKSINFDLDRESRTLCRFVEKHELQCQFPISNLGRAGKRLANAVALVQHLRKLGQSSS